jgi:hypothetical protein
VPLRGDQYATLIHVSDYVSSRVDGLERRGAVHPDVQQEGPVGFRKVHLALRGTVELVDLTVVHDPRHHDANGWPLSTVVKGAGRPSRDAEQVRLAEARHCNDFGRLLRIDPGVIDLGDSTAVGGQFENGRLAALTELASDGDRPTHGIK